ncbi:MAG: tRNA-dihydrouridine synthase [Deltaproteobacteria bacterium]|nr:MAG: tRNA-dihydrouridine synthase [Deltaproteobacteria bacterium]
MQENQPFIYLAPLKGLTDYTFRTCYAEHFGGVDGCVAPFINPQRHSRKDKLLRDILPENNRKMPVIPQLLYTNKDDFLAAGRRLADLGYEQVNWNLGCPMPRVAKKRRGSGLLPYPEKIMLFLDQVLPLLPIRLSIKTRLGFNQFAEMEQLMPRLNDYPLVEIIIHARLGRQRYSGSTDPESFIKLKAASRHTLVYNGDITSPEIFSSLVARLGGVNRWMIGRGIIADPFLPMKIKTGRDQPDAAARLAAFHDELYRRYEQRLAGPAHLLGRMKQIWQYLAFSFPEDKKSLKRLNKAGSKEQYLAAARHIFETYQAG